MKILFVLIAAMLLSGCQTDMNRNEIGDVDFVRAMGVDRAEDITVSLLLDKDIKKATAGTVFEAYEKIAAECDKPITLAHTKYFILGKKSAGENIAESIDFITRDEKVKTDIAVYITQKSTAEEFLGSSENIAENLDFFSRKILFYSTEQSNTLTDLHNPKITSLLPMIASDGEELTSDGYAVVQEMNVLAFSDEKEATGLNFIGNRVRSGGVFTEYAGMVIYDSKTKLKKGENPILDIRFTTNIKEVTQNGNFEDMNYIEKLTTAQNDYIRSIVESAVSFLSENNINFAGCKWENAEIRINSKITGTFDIE